MATKKKTASKAKSKSKSKSKKPVVKAKSKAAAKSKGKAKAAAKKPAAKKAAVKKPAAAKPTSGFAALAAWERVPTAEAEYDFLTATNDSVAYEDCFGQAPEHLMVHRGNVKIAGPLSLDGWKAPEDARQTVYIIDGDLEIDGSLLFDQSDICTTLWVTGNMKLQRAALLSTAMLVVGGSLEVGDVLVTDLEDAGHLIVHGSLSAQTWVDLTFRGCIELGASQGRFLSDFYSERTPEEGAEPPLRRSSLPSAPATPAIAPALLDDGRVDYNALRDAISKNTPILN